MRRHEEAEEMYKRALAHDPDHVNTLCSYGAFMARDQHILSYMILM